MASEWASINSKYSENRHQSTMIFNILFEFDTITEGEEALETLRRLFKVEPSTSYEVTEDVTSYSPAGIMASVMRHETLVRYRGGRKEFEDNSPPPTKKRKTPALCSLLAAPPLKPRPPCSEPSTSKPLPPPASREPSPIIIPSDSDDELQEELEEAIFSLSSSSGYSSVDDEEILALFK